MIETAFRTIISVDQLSIYGALSDFCDNTEIAKENRGDLCWSEQSDSMFEPAKLLMKTPLLSTEDPAHDDLLQKYQERVERLSQQSRVIKICIDAGFLTTVEVGQDFLTMDTVEFSHFCRTSGMSWIHFAERWKIIWPERLDSSEYQNWTCVRSHNQLFAR